MQRSACDEVQPQSIQFQRCCPTCDDPLGMPLSHGLANTEATRCYHVGRLLTVLHSPLQTLGKVLCNMVLVCSCKLSWRAQVCIVQNPCLIWPDPWHLQGYSSSNLHAFYASRLGIINKHMRMRMLQCHAGHHRLPVTCCWHINWPDPSFLYLEFMICNLALCNGASKICVCIPKALFLLTRLM